MRMNMKNIYGYGVIKNNIILQDAYYTGYEAKYRATNTENKAANVFLVNFSLSLTFVFLMWLSANSFFYLPFTPVPVTMQVFTVLFAAFALGSKWAFISQMQYIILGIAGVPLFAGFKSGIAAIAGPSGGYILGFAASSLAAGVIYQYFTRPAKSSLADIKHINSKTDGVIPVFFTALMSLFIIYTCGYFHLAGFLFNIAGRSDQSGGVFLNAFILGIFPFLLFDMLKIMGIIGLQKITGLKK
jgi:biotin transport system substrate-specific component